MTPRVLITTTPFAEVITRPLDLLREHGITPVMNPAGRRLTEAELIDLVGEFDVIVAGTEQYTAAVVRAARRLRLLARVGIGLDSVDLAATRTAGALVTYTPDAPAPAVSELTVGLMIALVRHVAEADRAVRHGSWRRMMGTRLSALTIGVIGAGRIGTRVVRHLAGGFPGVRLLVHDIVPEAAARLAPATAVDKETLLRESDIITVHVPLTPATRGLIGAAEISEMKPSAVVVNTARGNIIDEAALADALRARRIAGAAVDVFEREPYAGELAGIDTCLLTCHMGSMSVDCRAQMELEAVEEVIRFSRGESLRCLVPREEYEAAGVML